MNPVESFRGPDLSIAHEFSNYPSEDFQRLPIQAVRTTVIKTRPSSLCVPYFVFRIHPEGFVIALN